MRALSIGFAVVFPQLCSAEQLVVGTEARFPPITFLDRDGALVGRDKDIGDEICVRAEWECEWIVTDFDALLPGLESGRFDFVIAGLSASPDRAEIVDFTEPYHQPQDNIAYFVGLSGEIEVADATIAVQAQTTHSSFLEAQGFDVRPYSDCITALNAMISGETDLYFGPGLFIQDMVEQGYDMLVANGRQNVPSSGTAIAVAQDRDDLREDLNAIIARMWEDGTMDLLHRKWAGNGTDT
ncbi:transporter substrate-binding domain-containing protein [Alexandriicola marinus]|uniref:ABC transporter substrate-binding protein n=1 Tax=Alexandriicola marinus TaxID=2081710 RepID=UPI000FDAEB07|nr:transporter substrate-binding domain-containing protein [Alexandriicola marinus]